MKKNYIKIALDVLMALTFALLMDPRDLNGLPFHEIAGLIIGVAVLTHIGLNYRWVLSATRKIFTSTLPGKTRFNYALNILLLLSMSTIIITGILISRVVFPNLAVEGSRSIRELHNLSSNFTLVLLGIHIAVHWQWVMNICKKIVKSKERKLRTGVIAGVILSAAILAGGIQWFASSTSPAGGDFNPAKFQQERNGQSFRGDNFPQQDFNSNNANFHREGEFGHRGVRSPFMIILTYFLILTVIIVPVYYLEKKIIKKKKQLQNP